MDRRRRARSPRPAPTRASSWSAAALVGRSAATQAAGLGLADRFVFPGQVRNVADYLACLDLFMLTSRVEGLPNSLIEAQLAGVPVVTADVGGAGETFEDGSSGRKRARRRRR